MANNYQRRLQKAQKISADALSTFERAAVDLELAAQMQRETYDAIKNDIANLESQAAAAEAAGRRASDAAKRLRDLVL